jgi:predicted RNase H-like nuclease (RuvC/YqgF family)
LQFATRVRNISLGPAHKNVNTKNLEESLGRLKQELRENKSKRNQLEQTVADLKKDQ